MGHVQMILDIYAKKNMPVIPTRQLNQAQQIDMLELKRKITLYSNEINHLNREINRYKNLLYSRRLTDEGRRWRREAITQMERDILDFETRRSASIVKLNLYR
jgi:hypothetical protein